MVSQKGPGRPRKSIEDLASETIRFRVRAAEAELIRRAAKRTTHLSLSGWIREKLLKAAEEENDSR